MKEKPIGTARGVATERDGRIRRIPGYLTALGVALALATPVMWTPAPAGESQRGSGTKRCNRSVRECVEYMSKMLKATGWVGVELTVDEATGIYTIEKVIAGSPAEEADIKRGDVLRNINGLPMAEFHRKILSNWGKANYKPGQSVTYMIERGGHDRRLEITLAPMPAEILARYIGQHLLEHAEDEEGKR
jgi:hypothetical protein